MVVRPLVVSLVAHTGLGGALAFVAVGVLSDVDGGGGVALAGLLFAAAAYVAIRSLCMRVRLGDGKVAVTGLLWSRTIPARSVTEVTDFPAIRWMDSQGRRRWTPIVGLMSGDRMVGFVARHNQEQVRRLRQLVKQQHR